MAKIFPFDRREAESYARSLRKQRAREAQKAADAAIWRELVEEDIQKSRERNDRHNGHKVRQPKAKQVLTDAERGMLALQWAIDIFNAAAEHSIQIIKAKRPVSYHGQIYPWAHCLAMLRASGLQWSHPPAYKVWLHRAADLLGKDEVAALVSPPFDTTPKGANGSAQSLAGSERRGAARDAERF